MDVVHCDTHTDTYTHTHQFCIDLVATLNPVCPVTLMLQYSAFRPVLYTLCIGSLFGRHCTACACSCLLFALKWF